MRASAVSGDIRTPTTHGVAVHEAGPSISALDQALAPPRGLVVVKAFPRSSTATHSDDDGHATALRLARTPAATTLST
jgi:hypothetical protein